MTSKDIKTMVSILVIGAVLFGGLLGWAEHANHISDHDMVIGRSMETLQVGGGK